MVKALCLLSILIAVVLCACGENSDGGMKRVSPASYSWMLFYGTEAPLSKLEPYDLLVLEPGAQIPFELLSKSGKEVLGYVSLGEINESRPYFGRMRDAGLLLEENPNWKGSFSVDVRRPEWKSYVIESIIPGLIRQGFTGIFIDTLDNPPYLEGKDPKRFAGMKKAAESLVQDIRQHYPSLRIMLNRGYDILPDVADSIDYTLAESLYWTYSFAQKRYYQVPEQDYLSQQALLRAVAEDHPGLRIFTLDYCDAHDVATAKRIYAEQRRNGFYPLVSEIGLNAIIPEPR